MKKHFLTATILCFSIYCLGQIVNIEDKRFRLKDSTDFQGNLTLGWNLNRNTATIWSGNGAILLEKNQNKHFFIGYGFMNLLRTGDRNLLNDRMGHLRHNFDINRWLVFEEFLQGQYSQQLRIKHRYLAGLGLRYKLHHIIGKRIYLGTAGMFEQMAFQQDETNVERFRLSNYVSFQIPLYQGSKILSTTYYQPILNQIEIRRISSQTSISLPLGKGFSFNSAFTLLSDNDPRIASEVPDLTYQWTNGLKWELK